MQKCPHCHVTIRTRHTNCPLCHGQLDGDINSCEEIFPILSHKNSIPPVIIRLISFICLISAIICSVINFSFPNGHHWALYVDIIILFVWIISITGILKRRNLLKMIVWESIFTITASAVFDIYTKSSGLTVNYIYPCVCIAALITSLIIIHIQNLNNKDYMIYLLMIDFAGIIPIIFIISGILSTKIFSVICLLLSTTCLIGLIMFRTENVKNEITKKFHF